ncbi:MAG: hypothetical protein AAFP70_13080 [Calditrichota bacterium]
MLTKISSKAIFIIMPLIMFVGCSINLLNKNNPLEGRSSFEEEIIYHIFQRSFYDANGDG